MDTQRKSINQYYFHDCFKSRCFANLFDTTDPKTKAKRTAEMNQWSKSSFRISKVPEGVILVKYMSNPYARTRDVDSNPEGAA